MKTVAFILGLFAAAASAAPNAGQAILQFEIDPDTFTSDTPIAVPGTITVDQSLIAATIATVSGVADPDDVQCQAFNGNTKVAEPFTLEHFTTFNGGAKVLITTITCQ
ncbi:hypothetical protein NKR23_g6116 [Pleurostoma richardsiae]|uniref:Uncharacterized protein n=1 Tax=Pleurostoma richardsiae TaxID=41990 RepID=A0AA38VSY9_9PEZI|nr:hypothetical protein NKR23_g6116 [Pleurostoma richardsiae]